MSKKNNKRIKVAGVVGVLSAVVGTGTLAYTTYNKYKSRKRINEFNLLKLEEDEFLTKALEQINIIDEEIAKLKEEIPLMIENIESELSINNPNKFAKTVKKFKDIQKVNTLDIIVPLEVNNIRLDRFSSNLESIKKDYSFLSKKLLKAYVTGNISELQNEELFTNLESEVSFLGNELSLKLINIDEE